MANFEGGQVGRLKLGQKLVCDGGYTFGVVSDGGVVTYWVILKPNGKSYTGEAFLNSKVFCQEIQAKYPAKIAAEMCR